MLPIAGLLLLVVFGTFSAAVLPLIMAILTIPLALAVTVTATTFWLFGLR